MDQAILDYINTLIMMPTVERRVSEVQTPMSLKLLATVPLNEGVNQCQGFCYNSKKDVFVLACINEESTKQIIYELDPSNFNVVNRYEYKDKNNLGHMNTLTYNPKTNKLYTTNAIVNGYIVTPINADTLQVESPIKLSDKVFNLAYDTELNQFVSILPLTNAYRTINYYDARFKRLRSVRINAQHSNLNNNGAYAHNGSTIFTTLSSFVFVNKGGKVQSIMPYTSGMEVEDMDYRKGIMYVAVNYKGKVQIYGVPKLPFDTRA